MKANDLKQVIDDALFFKINSLESEIIKATNNLSVETEKNCKRLTKDINEKTIEIRKLIEARSLLSLYIV